MRIIILLLVLVLHELPVFAHEGHDKAFGSNNAVTATSQKVHISPSGQKSIGLRVEPVKLQFSETYLDATGTARAADDKIHYVTSSISGVVRAIHVKQNDNVKKGQTLATIYSADVARVLGDLLEQRASIKSELAKMRVQSEREIDIQTKGTVHFANDLAREKQLLDEGVTARKSYLDAKHAHDTAYIQLESIKKQQVQDLALLEQRRETITAAAKRHLSIMGLPAKQIEQAVNRSDVRMEVPILAPATGSLYLRDVTLGESIDASKHLFSIVGLSPIWVSLDIHQNMLEQLKLGQTVEVKTPAEKTIKGTISSIASVVDPQERTTHVRVVCENRSSELKPDMFVTAKILTGTGAKKIVIAPTQSIIKEGNRYLVYVKYGNDFQPVSVTIGASTANGIEVLDGLYEGDLIVVNGARQIKSQSMLAKTQKTEEKEHGHDTRQKESTFGTVQLAITLFITLFVGIAMGTGLTLFLTRRKESQPTEANQKEESLT